ncbi:DUF3000 domain-containing protein [Rhodococcus aerolatus]
MSTSPAGTAPRAGAPADFRTAVAELAAVRVRDEIALGPIRPPQQLAPWSYALGAEVGDGDEAGATGRLILLHDPDGHEAWGGTLRLVAYVQADLDADLAADPLLPDVGWSWLVDALGEHGARHTALGGTVTTTSSVRFGDIAGPTRTHQVELRASWTAADAHLDAHARAFCAALAHAAGLAPAGTAPLVRHPG